ncbi:SDR family oxidoreductase [Aquibacillus rhizosphaerae]|uniref:SDR family NAD(P)-dependent oxidoreductase n=1 Tax=Aquibacillus rhizosphaerae TaxID=3051431 RepID=A0ABT7L170_9BACI|nr:SDR family NAD(P)-dependent oxidoreductase [Aquibacillus sp. LR5S19]MDL4839589.1 SDR family NAD(P)-dependent oxidoreductase [Aquibacillus sp. LR5S19]
MSIIDKVAIITGAGSGIGHETAIHLANAGVQVCLFDISEENLIKTKTEIKQLGFETTIYPFDISNNDQVMEAFKHVYNCFGRVDIVFANAGIAGNLAAIEKMEISEWDKTINTNVNGTFLTIKNAIPYLKKKGGSIIITSSVSGNRVFSQAGFSAYSTSKASQLALMKMAALELAAYQIRVNAICPGAISTNIGKSIDKDSSLHEVEVPIDFPLGDQPLEHRAGSAIQVASLVHFLASDQSKHITGTEIYIDGGESLLR